MIRKLAVLICVAALLFPAIASAVDEEDFQVKTTANLINLCDAEPGGPLTVKAIHFCEGYCVGAYHYYLAANSGPEGNKWICFEEPYPSRDSVIGMFVDWAKANPQYMNDNPAETLFRFMIGKWPCK